MDYKDYYKVFIEALDFTILGKVPEEIRIVRFTVDMVNWVFKNLDFDKLEDTEAFIQRITTQLRAVADISGHTLGSLLCLFLGYWQTRQPDVPASQEKQKELWLKLEHQIAMHYKH